MATKKQNIRKRKTFRGGTKVTAGSKLKAGSMSMSEARSKTETNSKTKREPPPRNTEHQRSYKTHGFQSPDNVLELLTDIKKENILEVKIMPVIKVVNHRERQKTV